MKKTYLDDPAYKGAIRKAEAKGKRRPERIFVQLNIPFDCYEAFITRFFDEYSELKFKHTRNTVTKADVLGFLMWLWGRKYDTKFSADIMKAVDLNLVRPAHTGRKSNNPKGRPPRKHLINLFDQPVVQEEQKLKSKGEDHAGNE